jgi:hypothetical protein
MKNPPLTESPEQRKIRLEREANALFADINNSFGKAANRKAKPKAEPKEPALTTFLKEANAIAKAMESPTWKPVAIVHYIIKQQCECCGKMPECVGGTLVRHSHNKRKDTWDFPRPDMRSFSHLAQIIIEETTSVPFCPECLRAGYFDRMAFHDEIQAELDGRAQNTLQDIMGEIIDSDDLPEESDVETWQHDTEDDGEEIIIGEEE